MYLFVVFFETVFHYESLFFFFFFFNARLALNSFGSPTYDHPVSRKLRLQAVPLSSAYLFKVMYLTLFMGEGKIEQCFRLLWGLYVFLPQVLFFSPLIGT